MNAEKVKSACAQARKLGAEVVLFPELMVTGYPPEDLLLKKGFLEDSKKTLKKNRFGDTRPDSRGRVSRTAGKASI